MLYQGQQLLDYVLAKILQRVTQPGKQNTTRYAQKPEHTAPPVSSVRGHGPVPSPGRVVLSCGQPGLPGVSNHASEKRAGTHLPKKSTGRSGKARGPQAAPQNRQQTPAEDRDAIASAGMGLLGPHLRPGSLPAF